jgi:hypothetical protein
MIVGAILCMSNARVWRINSREEKRERHDDAGLMLDPQTAMPSPHVEIPDEPKKRDKTQIKENYSSKISKQGKGAARKKL